MDVQNEKRTNRYDFWTALVFTLLLVIAGVAAGWWWGVNISK